MDLKYFAHARAELEPLVPQDVRRVLDVACGDAAFSAGLRLARPELEIWGVKSHWRTGPKLSLLKLIFGRHMPDMRWLQFVVVARRRAADATA